MTAQLTLTILGCGSSGGVPRVGGDWGACDPQNPKNRRSRCSLWVEYQASDASEPTCVLIDTSPDLREQLLQIDAKYVDAVLFTHEHADQTHGIDDLRALAYAGQRRIPTYMNAHTHEHLLDKFGYCFEMPDGRVHPPILDDMPMLEPDKPIAIEGNGGTIEIRPIGLSHGPTPVLGFVLDGRAVYTPDVWDIDVATLQSLRDADVWVIDALRYAEHPTHAHCDKALSWLAKTQISRAVMTNMHIDIDYDIFSDELMGQFVPAYDGMVVNV